jgi:DNA-binding PadR family transcriptional regulator
MEEIQREEMLPSRRLLEMPERPQITFHSPRHWLILALLIESPSYGYEVAHRYMQRFALIVPPGTNTFYHSLDQLHQRDLIAQQHSPVPPAPPAARGARGRRIYYKATRKGIDAYTAWLRAPIRDEHWKAELLARIASAISIGATGLQDLLATYERYARNDRERAEALLDDRPQTPQILRTLLDTLVAQEILTKCNADERWAQDARSALDKYRQP